MSGTPADRPWSEGPWSEEERLAVLRRYAILDTPPERDFDDLARLASELLQAPIAAVSLIDAGRQWFKAEIGLGLPEIPLGPSICARAMLRPEEMVVPDLRADPRFAENPFVAAGPGLRFYAGEVLLSPEGLPLGTLCVLDTVPREDGLTEGQRFALRTLARQVTSLMALRRAVAERDAALATQREEAALSRQVVDSPLDYAIVATDLEGRVSRWNAGAEALFGWSEAEMLGQALGRLFTPEDRAAGRVEARRALALREGRADEARWSLRKDGGRFWANGVMTPLRDGAGRAVGFVKVVRDLTAQHRADAAVAAVNERYRLAARATNDAIWDWDLRSDTVQWNEALAVTHRWPAERVEPTGAWWLAQIHPEDRARVERGIHAVIDGTGTSWTEEYRFRRGDGSDARVLDRGYVIRDEAGAPARMIGAMLDLTERERTEAALRTRDERYRALFDSIDEGFCIIEFLDGPEGPLSDYVHIEANPAYAEQAGIPDVVGQRVRTMVPAEADGWVELYGGVLRTGVPIRFERELVATGRQLELAAFRIGPAEQRQVAVLFKDITPRKRAEAVLRETGDRLRLANAAAGIGTFDYDLRTGALTWDDRCRELFGLPPGAPVSYDTFLAGLHPEDRDRSDAAVRQALEPRGNGLFHVEYRTLGLEDGVLRWIAASGEASFEAGQAVRLIGTVIDISARAQAEEALQGLNLSLERQVEERTRERDRVWSATTDLMATAGLDGYLKAVNPAWTRMLGWTEAALLSRPFAELIDPEDRAEMGRVVARLAAGEGVRDFVDHVFCRDGSQRTIMWAAVPDGPLFHIVGRDITDQRRIEDQLRQSQKMEAVGHLTGGIAHDFNNLLTGITGSLELLRTRVAQGRVGEVERYIGAAQGAAQRAAALTHRLLAFSRRQTLDPRVVDVNRLIGGMEELVRRTVGPSIAVEVVGAGGLWAARVDPNQLENALLNLCINARDAMPGGGRITIETANKWLDARAARERDLPVGAYLSLCVTDTGTGMSPEVVARAFDPFFTTKPIGQGTGLGLSMIYGFVRQSGGQVRIYTELGQGTTMCLYLPRHLGEAAEAGEAASPARAPRAERGETVLVVDDEPTVRMLVTEVLEDLGYTAIEAGDGPEGLSVLQSGARIDLLVTDVGLPGGMNGRQLADAARVARPALKVLFITGYAENAAVGNGHLEPGMHVLTKPFAMDALATRIRDLIAEA